MADKQDFMEMLKKLGEMSDDSESLSDKANAVMDHFMDRDTREEAHNALIRQTFIGVFHYIVGTMGRKNIDKAHIAAEHLKCCMDVVLENNQWKGTKKMPGVSLLQVLRSVQDDD